MAGKKRQQVSRDENSKKKKRAVSVNLSFKSLLNLFRTQYGKDVSNDYPFTEAFRLIKNKYENKSGIKRVLYPGCYVHVTPSLFFSEVVYVDTFKGKSNCVKKFYQTNNVLDELVHSHCDSIEKHKINYHQQDYRSDFGEKDESFDLLISLSAGPITSSCLKFLKPKGLLFVDDEHADASIASSNPDLELVAALQGFRFRNLKARTKSDYRDKVDLITNESHLEQLFKLKKTGKAISKDQAIENSKVGRTKWPYPLAKSTIHTFAYVFLKR